MVQIICRKVKERQREHKEKPIKRGRDGIYRKFTKRQEEETGRMKEMNRPIRKEVKKANIRRTERNEESRGWNFCRYIC
jgi:hypothetical protein